MTRPGLSSSVQCRKDHLQGDGGHLQGVKLLPLHPYRGIRVRACSQRSSSNTAQEVSQDIVVLDAASFVAEYAFQKFYQTFRFYFQAGLFNGFPPNRRIERLTHVHQATRDTPLPFGRWFAALDQDDSAAIHDERTDAYERECGIFARYAIDVALLSYTKS